MKEDIKIEIAKFIEQEHPKGSKHRGVVTVALTLFIIWLEQEGYKIER